MTVYINIGSNVGNRRSHIEKAIADITLSGLIVEGSLKLSSFIESVSWGYVSENKYLNVGMSFDSTIGDPHEILRILLLIEGDINGSYSHRDEDGNYKDRVLDIDIVAIDDLVIETDELTVPHPRMHLREFVLLPMRELNDKWIHPKLGLNVEALINLNDTL